MEVKNSASVCQIKSVQVKNNCNQGFMFQIAQACNKLKGKGVGKRVNLFVRKKKTGIKLHLHSFQSHENYIQP